MPRAKIPTISKEGGINKFLPASQIGDEEFVELVNFDLSRPSFKTRRKGMLRFLNTRISTNALTSAIRYSVFTGGAFYRGILLSDGAQIWKLSNGSLTSLISGLTAGAIWRGFNFDAYVYLQNGVDKPLRFDGTNIEPWGIAKPTFTAAYDIDTAGALSPTTGYRYKFRYKAAKGFSSNSDVNVLFAEGPWTDKKVHITGFAASSDAQVNKIEIFRTTDGGATYYFLVEIDDTAEEYFDELDDTSLMVGEIIEEDHDLPTVCREVAEYNRMGFMGGAAAEGDVTPYEAALENRMYYSRVNYPEYVPYQDQAVTGLQRYWDLSPDGTDTVVIRRVGEHLYIFTRRSVYHLIQSGPDAFILDKIPSNTGAISSKSVDIVGNTIIFAGTGQDGRGLYFLSGLTLQTVPTFKNVEEYFNGIDETYFDKVAAIYYPTKQQFWVSIPSSGATENDITLIYHKTSHAWAVDDRGFTDFALAAGVEDDTNIERLYGIDRFGFIHRLDYGDNDGVPSGTRGGRVTGAAAGTLTDSLAAFCTSGAGLTGLRVGIVDGKGIGQKRFIASNTAVTLTLISNWGVTPDSSSIYVIGGIDTHLRTKAFDFGNPLVDKLLDHIEFLFERDGYTGEALLGVGVLLDLQDYISHSEEIKLAEVAKTIPPLAQTIAWMGLRGKYFQFDISNSKADASYALRSLILGAEEIERRR